MATIDTDGWRLESAEERHLAAPDKFLIPSLDERRRLEIGCMVQLLALLLGRDGTHTFVQCERLWVTVQEISASGYTGRLEPLPVTSNVLQPGARIAFHPHHVASIVVPVTDPRHSDYVEPN